MAIGSFFWEANVPQSLNYLLLWPFTEKFVGPCHIRNHCWCYTGMFSSRLLGVFMTRETDTHTHTLFIVIVSFSYTYASFQTSTHRATWFFVMVTWYFIVQIHHILFLWLSQTFTQFFLVISNFLTITGSAIVSIFALCIFI